MTITLRGIAFAATLSLALVPAAFAQDAMATDAPAPAGGAMMAGDTMTPTMTPLTDEEYNLCMRQAGAITFPAAKASAEAACHGLHLGMDVMATLESMGMAPTGGDAMAPADAMAPTDAMAPATK
jgi:hypothetical protein